ncbi:threonine aldolase family protein [Arthrobacter sp. HMWF013]|uniref:threonine aldolase family protein n=1 Tax=Arthrobacter sp. HMWF013 TaxID=2056849 RepID=UPI000D368A96|nr:low specificity L-threonine aldolase [Arthrobacter sp. HMWF013]PTT68769.1 threonine aldolase [Arthrobacter sp. HMWF013]
MSLSFISSPGSLAVAGRLHDPGYRGFASDNYAGAHAEIIAAVEAANEGHVTAYGEDAYTGRLQQVVQGHFGAGATAYPVFNGTGANVLALQALLPRWGAVVCASTAHINTDENGAPERIAGIKLLPVPTADGKLTPELIDAEAWGWGDEHRAQPLVVSITQTTELGTCYSPEEIQRIAEHVHARGMKLHMDGARLANAAAHLRLPLRSFTTDVGVDVLSFGGTKNGLLFGEAVVWLDSQTDPGMNYLRKMNMQLASKMRFVSAQLIALLSGDLWLRSASHANDMAQRLRAGVSAVDEVRITQATESNGVFAILPPGVAEKVRESFRFYDWDQARGEVRWMCSWDTTENDVESLLAAVKAAVASTPTSKPGREDAAGN